jgi:hypothetical protein
MIKSSENLWRFDRHLHISPPPVDGWIYFSCSGRDAIYLPTENNITTRVSGKDQKLAVFAQLQYS